MDKKQEAIKAYQQYLVHETRTSEEKWKKRAEKHIAKLEKEIPETHPETWEEEIPETKTEAIQPIVENVVPEDKTLKEPIPKEDQIECLGECLSLQAQATKAFDDKNYETAFELYQKALKEDPSIELRYRLGVTLAVLGKLNEAIIQWELILQKDPSFKPAIRNLERAQRKQAQEQRPDPPELTGTPNQQMGLGKIYVQDDRPVLALRAFFRAHQNANEATEPLVLAGQTLLRLCAFPHAALLLDRAITIQSTAPGLYYQQGLIHFFAKQYQEALQHFEQAVDTSRDPYSLVTVQAKSLKQLIKDHAE